tara:strand:+ start:250 stop:897 length:648 start_codon:yes stop_codon:yes gene_type:complete
MNELFEKALTSYRQEMPSLGIGDLYNMASNALITPAFAPELSLEELEEIQNRNALDKAGLMALDDAGLDMAPIIDEFSRKAKPSLNLGFAKQAGRGLLSLITKNPVITGIGGLLGLLGDRANLPGTVGGQDLRGDTGLDTFRRSTSLANFVQRRRDQQAREEAAARGLAKQRQAALQSMRGPIGRGGEGGGFSEGFDGGASAAAQSDAAAGMGGY